MKNSIYEHKSDFKISDKRDNFLDTSTVEVPAGLNLSDVSLEDFYKHILSVHNSSIEQYKQKKFDDMSDDEFILVKTDA